MAIYSDSGYITGVDFPLIRPTLDLNFAATKTLDRRITFTRDSIGTYVDELGIVRYASNNVPRFDHDPTTGESLGLLVEESRTNFLPYSADIIGQSNWLRAGVLTITPSPAITAPDGTTTAVALRDNGSNGQHTLYDDISVSDITTVYTASCWVKQGSKDHAELFANGGGTANTVTIGYHFDLVNKTATYTGTAGFSAGTSATITEYPNGWFRITITGDVANTATGAGTYRFHVRPRTSASGAYQGDNTDGIYVWGPQVEEGSFATSYIPTSGSTVTRAADIAKITGTNFTDFFNQTEGTIKCSYWLGNDTTGLRVFQINNSDNSVIDIVAGSGGGNGGYGYVSTGGVAQANAGQSSANASYLNTLHVTTLAYKENDVAGINIKTGVLTTDTSAALDGAYNQVTFHQGAGETAFLNGHIQQVSYYPKRLPNAQLQGLTQQ